MEQNGALLPRHRIHTRNSLQRAVSQLREIPADSMRRSSLIFDGQPKQTSRPPELPLVPAPSSVVAEVNGGLSDIVSENVLMNDSETLAYIRSILSLPLLELGLGHLKGWGVKKDFEKARLYFEISSMLGDTDAQFQLAYMYEMGRYGVKKSKTTSAKYYRLVESVRSAKHLPNSPGLSWIWKAKYDPDEGELDPFAPSLSDHAAIALAQKHLKDLLVFKCLDHTGDIKYACVLL